MINQQSTKEKKPYEQMTNLIWLALKISRPELTLEQTKNIIINTGNHLQLEKLQNDHHHIFRNQ